MVGDTRLRFGHPAPASPTCCHVLVAVTYSSRRAVKYSWRSRTRPDELSRTRRGPRRQVHEPRIRPRLPPSPPYVQHGRPAPAPGDPPFPPSGPSNKTRRRGDNGWLHAPALRDSGARFSDVLSRTRRGRVLVTTCCVTYSSRSRTRPRAFGVFGPPSAMRAELSWLDQAVADAPLDQDLTILTDSLASMQKLEALQRKDFTEWLHCHPERALLESVVARINMRAKARVLTRVVKVPTHKAHPLNAVADAAASQAALEADIEGVVSHSDSGAVHFYLSGRLTEWGTNIRKHLIQVAAKQHKNHLSLLLCRQVDSEDADMASTSAQA